MHSFFTSSSGPLKLKQIKIKDFKRFTDLTVGGLPETARLLLLAGPNGSGKSSFFDALNTWHRVNWRKNWNWDPTYHRKAGSASRSEWSYEDVQIEFHGELPDGEREQKKAFYFRSAHRNEADFHLHRIDRSPDLLEQDRFQRMSDNDEAISQNYQRLANQALEDVFENAPGKMSLEEFRKTIIGKIRDSLMRLFPDLELKNLGAPLSDGTFRFAKGTSEGFLFKNLSGGEKAAFDLILDMVVSSREYDNTVFCIDEPEAHMNMRLQAELLSVLFDLMPENCQLVLATHSIGMMRRAMDIEAREPGSVVFLDFGDRDFDTAQIIEPVLPTRAFWHRVYAVALDDLATLVAPDCVVICEGSPKLPKATKNQSHDARCYEPIFEAEYPNCRFISGGSASEVETDRFVLTEALTDLVGGIRVVRLIDRDDRSENEIEEQVGSGVRVLSRRNLESYLFDDEVLSALSVNAGKPDKLEELLNKKKEMLRDSSGAVDDLKPISGELYNACKELLELTACGNNTNAFMRDTLAPLVQPGMKTYRQLKDDVFGGLDARIDASEGLEP